MSVECASLSSASLFPAAGVKSKKDATQKPFNLDELLPLNISSESIAHDTAEFNAAVLEELRAAGIELDQPLVLSNDANGYVRVQGDMPHKAEIEKLFADNRDLQQGYAKLSSHTSMLNAVKGYSSYANEYSRLAGNFAAQKALVESEIAKNNRPVYVTVLPFKNEIPTLVAR